MPKFILMCSCPCVLLAWTDHMVAHGSSHLPLGPTVDPQGVPVNVESVQLSTVLSSAKIVTDSTENI